MHPTRECGCKVTVFLLITKIFRPLFFVLPLFFERHAEKKALIAAQQAAERRYCRVAGERCYGLEIFKQLGCIHDNKQLVAVHLCGADKLLYAAGVCQLHILLVELVCARHGLVADSLREVAVLVEGHLHLALDDAGLCELLLQVFLNLV